MESLSYCLQCFKDVKDWEILFTNPVMTVHRCPFCKTIHTIYSDGTVRIKN